MLNKNNINMKSDFFYKIGNFFRLSNYFRKHKVVVCYDLLEIPDDMCIGDVMEVYNKTGFVLVSPKENDKINTHIVRL